MIIDVSSLTHAMIMGTFIAILKMNIGNENGMTIVQKYLDQQQDMTAVETYSSYHDTIEENDAHGVYKQLIPGRKLNLGEQYAFQVDMDKCSGCKACVTGCHNKNGLGNAETWRDVGLLFNTESGPDDSIQGKGRFSQHLTTACHHCLEPACMTSCPANAYEKDAETGVVRHLDDNCIGCQYCTLTCPYGVPKYNSIMGIVRKCDMCIDRLKVGEAPACAQSCPNGAISVTIVDVKALKEKPGKGFELPHTPDPNVTFPSTQFISEEEIFRNAVPADQHIARPEHPEWPLVFMLVLTQMSVGGLIAAFFSMGFTGVLQSQNIWVFTAAWAVGLVGLGFAPLHLGQPLLAHRAFLGFRTSWLSREIILFTLYAGLSSLYIAAGVLGKIAIYSIPPALGFTLAVLTVLAGLGSVASSVMIYFRAYVDYWKSFKTAIKFFGTVVILGSILTALTSVLVQERVNVNILLITSMATFISMWASLSDVQAKKNVGLSLQKTTKILTGPLKRWTIFRFSLGGMGGLFLPAFIILVNTNIQFSLLLLLVSFGLLFAAELIDRALFFAAGIRPRMPGTYLTEVEQNG